LDNSERREGLKINSFPKKGIANNIPSKFANNKVAKRISKNEMNFTNDEYFDIKGSADIINNIFL